ncbi:TetR/AcrR family transcriptional regulator [Rhodospirillum rubrum]|uniref:Transcriptional regulator, TetR family n=1 Tax=Rhodospirillum rubrum (strain ATCC 11170 / ATH 1.1.1 / DSM 467 / LMG 4362 / NCIMB 8255 / S1) TaxID=269796 RepID=Q2RW06_RHORT|nr:TetR/AcrR family transcriptional regulator [Rhodospirillum rubrum]ABC21689.1 transcriptional regulator, TetR family [Rhodospirillum rubrum ATCC 11170]AEO47387.1 TetR family transcriptional regulator [Rhodospirillum rubrum F11]MBK5953241.1 TetR/AcrR family transcriptional regulator [Rhodospirillum rubrum]QXG81351.1 TetR/AcrR family transcriptional regulator [Rhodospirillum rubrum]HAQ01373.1 TetR/AcrR family transcriptional regulator [Rhodospirillum rubrum]
MGRPASDTRQKLIDTALELMWTNSYGTVSVDDICKAADVKKGSFYHFFPSKVDLSIAAMEQSHHELEETYDKIFSPAVPPIERFMRMADCVIALQAEVAEKYGHVCGCPCASLGSEMAGQEDGIRAKFEDLAHRKERYYENALRDMVGDGLLAPTTDVKVLAQEIYTYLVGQMMIARIQNDLAPLKRDLKRGLARLLGVVEPA